VLEKISGTLAKNISNTASAMFQKPISQHTLLSALFLFASWAFSSSLLAQDDNTTEFTFRNSIEHITGELYRASNGAWHSIFLVTEEGIILADPLNTAFAEWLKVELDERFKVPVRYVIYSHSHFDHAAGAGVFAATATIVAHERVLLNMDGRFPHMPGDMIERNNNGVFDRDEIMIPTTTDPGICGMFDGWFEQMDQNKDGIMTPAELQADILPPEITYSDRMSLTLGGKTIELIHPGKNHGDDMTVVLFPDEGVVFASDMIPDALVRDDIRSIPSACGPLDGTPIDEWIRSYEAVAALDFERFAGGHGGIFSKEDISLPIQFLHDLKAAVQEGLANGLTLEEMQAQIILEKYSDWAYYDRLRPKTIDAAYRNLIMFRY
jgi:glyoxylase-like metal-dependent hydrolase (beta-lactamase superfamily II)